MSEAIELGASTPAREARGPDIRAARAEGGRAERRGPPGRTERWVLSACGLAAFFGLWWLAATLHWASPQFLPAPDAVAREFVSLTQRPFAGLTLQAHLASSLQRYAMGFALAAAVGVPLGLLMGWFRWLDAIVAPLFEAVRFVAPIAWVPFAALWFGTGIGGPVLIIFTGAFAPCVVNAYRGARQVEHRYIEAAQMLGASHLRMMTEVLLPASMPSIVAGLRVAAGLGWMSLVGAELIVASGGIGYLMVKGQASVNTAVVMSGMVAIGAVGLAIDVALRTAERLIERRLLGARARP